MTDQLHKAAEMALPLLVAYQDYTGDSRIANKCGEAIEALRQALAQPEQFQLVCKKCGADRTKDDCKGERIKCGIMGEAQSAQPEQDDDAYEYAKRLAECIWEKYYKEESPHWRPCHDVLGVLTQIDNMT